MIVDAHLDLAYSALSYQRNLLGELADIRVAEQKRPNANGIATVTFPELRRGKVGVVFGTLFAVPQASALLADSTPFVYTSQAEAARMAQQQLDYYHKLADENPSIRLIGSLVDLEAVVASQENEQPEIGIVPLMEGADASLAPEALEEWWERGVRIIGPAWADTPYARAAGRDPRLGFTKAGYLLMEVMADFGFVLDVSHLSEKAVLEAVERYEGQLVATHCNARALAPHVDDRNLSDTQIRLLGERGGVIGIVLYNKFLRRGHLKGERRERVTLDHVVAHIDHICQLLGDAEHVGIGSDFDGGFGWADIPFEMHSVADLELIGTRLAERGYGEADVAGILGGNWVRVLREGLG